jgi:hypothetical protein
MDFAVFFRNLNNKLADRGDQPVMLATAEPIWLERERRSRSGGDDKCREDGCCYAHDG